MTASKIRNLKILSYKNDIQILSKFVLSSPLSVLPVFFLRIIFVRVNFVRKMQIHVHECDYPNIITVFTKNKTNRTFNKMYQKKFVSDHNFLVAFSRYNLKPTQTTT